MNVRLLRGNVLASGNPNKDVILSQRKIVADPELLIIVRLRWRLDYWSSIELYFTVKVVRLTG